MKRNEKQTENKEKRISPAMQKAKDNMFTVIAAILVVSMLLSASALSFYGRDKTYSENENRYLEMKPVLSASSVFEGKYSDNMESYLSDHFFARDTMVKARTRLDIFFGKSEINNVYIGKKHFLFEKPSEYDEERVGKTLETVNSISVKHNNIPSYFALVPNSCEVLSELMPANAPTQNQREQIKKIYSELKGVSCIDIDTQLKVAKNKENLYYRTDHHWTTEAAEIAFNQIAKDMKLNSSNVKYNSFCVTNSFQGTMASSTGLFSARDSIYIRVPQNDINYVVTYVDENKKSATLFDSSKLDTKSKYEVFFGGNYAQTIIDTDAKSDRTLLVIKDSYANCVIPMLLPYYKKIVILDPRYYTDSFEQTLKKENPTEILWLYNVNTFLNDTSIMNSMN